MSFNTPGFIKFWVKNQLLETKYQSINEIPIMNLNRQEIRINSSLPSNNNPSSPTLQSSVYIVHCKESKKCESVAQQLITHSFPENLIYKIPDQDSHENFTDIRENCPGCLGKMVFNGKQCHPLMKFLKKNSLQAFYDFNTNSAKKDIRKSGVFVHNPKTLKTEYYSEQKLSQLWAKVEEKPKQEQKKK